MRSAETQCPKPEAKTNGYDKEFLVFSHELLFSAAMQKSSIKFVEESNTAKTIRSQLADMQSEPANRELRIDKVGVRGVRYPIQVRDKVQVVQNTVATIGMYVDLPEEFKGTHMSRFLEVLHAHGNIIHVDSIPAILNELRRRLAARIAHIEIEFPYFIEKKAPVSGMKGLVDYTVRFTATAEENKVDFITTVAVTVTTLCPCSKAISRYGAHNQRGLVTVSVRMRKRIWIEELIQIVEESASSEVYSILKREDEKAVTERAYENPVFVEDLVRNVAARLNEDPRVLWYRVEAENFESIHTHNAYACIERFKEEERQT